MNSELLPLSVSLSPSFEKSRYVIGNNLLRIDLVLELINC